MHVKKILYLQFISTYIFCMPMMLISNIFKRIQTEDKVDF